MARRAPPLNLALFDFDGTITVGDTWTPFPGGGQSAGRLAIARVVLAPVAAAYRTGMLSAARGRELAGRAAFRGQAPDVVRKRGVEYATSVLPTMLRDAALDRLNWQKAQGDRVVVVSASLDAYLHPWCDALGVDCICTTLEERAGRLTGRYLEGDCSRNEKARRIQSRFVLTDYPIVYAYADNRDDDDREMLALAHRPCLRWD